MRQSFLIYCEGETEVGYFSSFKKRAKRVKTGNALAVVQEAIAQKKANNTTVDQYWVVFDKDDSTDDQFDKAVQLALANGLQVAWSNQAFELWFILHFQKFTQKCHRNQYEKVLKVHLPLYSAADKGEEQGKWLSRETIHLADTVIANANSGRASFGTGLKPSEMESCTTIQDLVVAIRENS
ncbi:RloB family protein [Paraflavisolibacter sp. H34]|uniref:RloB family protein n=1 Tax=Huijunlia imazamoxiresistens TaxID=3127457 RepID=UPI00301A2588